MDDCIFCGHWHLDRESCDAPVCGDGCCHCGCFNYLPLDARKIREFVRELNIETANYARQSREQAEEARKWRAQRDFQFRARNNEIERNAKLEKKLAKLQKKLAK